MKTKLIDIRNNLFDKLPTGHIEAWQLLEIIKNHLKQLDDYIDNEEPQYSKRFVEHCFKITNKNALDDFYNMWIKHDKDLSCKLISAEERCEFCGKIIEDKDHHICIND
jgi:hypothetical protein